LSGVFVVVKRGGGGVDNRCGVLRLFRGFGGVGWLYLDRTVYFHWGVMLV